MINYPFNLVPPKGRTPIGDNSWLAKRPFSEQEHSLEKDAPYFVAGEALADTINTAIAVGEPLLLTGEPRTGKTQAAYYAAYQLGVKCIHFQVKSDSTARDLLYDFDMVRYFRDAHLQNIEQEKSGEKADSGKSKYIDKRALWQAFDIAGDRGVPQVLLIDEIDKAWGDENHIEN